MTPIDTSTEAVERLLDGVTPGPWRDSKSYRGIVSDSPSGNDDAESVRAYGGHMVCESVMDHNRPFIAAARDLVPALLKERDDLRAKMVVAAEALKHYRETLCEGFCKGDVWADEGHSHPDIQRDCGGCLAASVLINCAALASSHPAYPDGVLHDPDGHWGDFLRSAVQEAEKAMRKFPQPNYVISKVAEEAGEVVKAAIHAAEGRETLPNLRAEMRQLVAMLYRLWVEGDAVHGLPPVSSALAASQPADPVTNAGSCQPVKVKPLVWAYVGGETWIARTPIGIASVQKDTHGWGVWLAGQNSESVCWHVENTLDAAKAAAQADYEARILSAIEPAPVTPAEAAKVLLSNPAALAAMVDAAPEQKDSPSE